MLSAILNYFFNGWSGGTVTIYHDTDFGVTGNGSDETSKLQTALNQAASAGAVLVMTKLAYISDTGLTIPSNSKVLWLDGAGVKLLPVSATVYNLLMCGANTNIILYAPFIDGSNESNTGIVVGGQRAGMGITIAGGSNITIYEPKIINCQADGIYIRGTYSGPNTPPSNITINSPYIRAAQRDAVSVVSCNGLTIRNLVGEDIQFDLPACLIDFEPNGNTDVLQNIKIIGSTSINCANGMRYSFQFLPGTNAQNVSITVSDYKDLGCTSKAQYWVALNKGTHTVTGFININRPTFVASALTTGSSSWDNSVVVTVSNSVVIA